MPPAPLARRTRPGRRTDGTDTNAVTFVYPDRDPEPMPLMDKLDVAGALLDRARVLLG